MFFANLQKGLPPEQCPDNDNHNVDTIDGLIMAVPVILANCGQPIQKVKQEAAQCTAVTRNSRNLPEYAGNLSELMCSVLAGTPLLEALSSSAGANVVQSA